jgi:putative membrane protein
VRLRMGLLAAAVTAGGWAIVATPARAQQQDDATSIAIVDAANTYDIEASGLAEKRTKNKDVEALAKQFVHDHSAVRQQDRDLAKKLGITPTPPKDFALTKDHEAAMGKLEKASTAQFDRTYLENEVAYHKAVIDAINTVLLPAIKNPELKTLVQQVGPAFNAHLVAAQNLLAKLPQ